MPKSIRSGRNREVFQAFPKNKIDIYAVIKSAQYAFNVVLAIEKDGQCVFNVPAEAVGETLIIGLVKTGEFCFELLELDSDGLTAVGKRRGAVIEVKAVDETHAWRRIKNFSQRL